MRYLHVMAFCVAVFLAAALNFAVQPMIGKIMLPQAGGTPSVWLVTLAFFQCALLAGYTLAYGLARLPVRLHVLLYTALLLAAFLTLPPGFAVTKDSRPDDILSILAALTIGTGLPFLVLAAANITLQRLYAHSRQADRHDPHFLYAASNLGSFLGLFSYPLVLEVFLPLELQQLGWTAVFAILVIVFVALLLFARHDTAPLAMPSAAGSMPNTWWLIPLLTSAGLVSFSGYITTDIAAIPLLWVLILGLYLLSFILAFSQRCARLNGRAKNWGYVFCATAYTFLLFRLAGLPALTLHVVLFFLISWGAHARLAELRPAVGKMPHYYLAIAAGGALGGSVIAFAAPLLFPISIEYALVICGLLFISTHSTTPARLSNAWPLLLCLTLVVLFYISSRLLHGPVWVSASLLALAVACSLFCMTRPRVFLGAGISLVIITQLFLPLAELTAAERNFFGVKTVENKTFGGSDYRVLLHGTTMHGGINLSNPGNPLFYYAKAGPLGDLWHTIKPKNTGVLGMGIGSVCGLRNADEHITYYEIDPQIVELARTQFDYDARCSNTSIILGDARLELAAQDAQGFDLLVVDTFSSDAIPVHLLTLEALKLYKHHLKPGGVIAINISNRYLDLLPVVAAISREAGLSWRSYYKGARRNELQEYAEEGVSHWVMLTSDAAKLNRLDVAKWQRQEVKAVRPWTDDYSNLLGTLGAD